MSHHSKVLIDRINRKGGSEFVGKGREAAIAYQSAVYRCKAAVNAGLQTDIDRAMTIEADVFEPLLQY